MRRDEQAQEALRGVVEAGAQGNKHEGLLVEADGVLTPAQLPVRVAEVVQENLPLVREGGAQTRPGHALHPQQGVTQVLLRPVIVAGAEGRHPELEEDERVIGGDL